MTSSSLIAVGLSTAAMISTGAGGFFALRLRERLPLLMGFAAGVVIGVVSFDLLPEIIGQIGAGGFDPRHVMGALAVGFLLFHVMEKLIIIHHHDECEHQGQGHKHPQVGILSALALIGHSFMDGIGIGLGFQISWKVGLVVGLAVVAHDFVDGMNTVILMIGNRNSTKQTLPYLACDAIAPTLGLMCTFFFRPSPFNLVLYLAFFAGFLLYIGASHILPEAHSEKSSVAVVALTLLGALFALGVSLVV
jgi:ZIP family zinc transporter